MSHWAELNDSNIVLRVLVADNNDTNEEGVVDEGFYLITKIYGGRWVQTSYNNNFRGKYAGIGDVYDEVNDIFHTPINVEEESG